MGSMENLKVAARIITVNLTLIGAAVLFLPFIAFKIKYGQISLSHDDIRRIASGLEVQQAHDTKGFNEAVKDLGGNQAYCNQPHPVIGWIDICGSNQFWGFSQVTEKVKDGGTYRVLLVGGSVANYIGKSGELETALQKRLSDLRDRRRLEVFNAALPGFKQPQQLAVINALLASGWIFDAIINIGGNNEIAFVANHLFREGYSPLLPYAHPERTLMAAKMLYKPQDECKGESPFSWHPVYQYIKIRCYRETLGKMKRFVHFQPYLSVMRYKDDIPQTKEDAIRRAIKLWLVSSRSAYAIASINGIRYLEVIQPSQYLEGSKTFSREEAKLVLSDRSMKVVGEGYSLVQQEDFGVPSENILDTRFIYAKTRQPVYSDNCCHLNQEGERILALSIAHKLLR